jgi:S1-C subfamily serine protease
MAVWQTIVLAAFLATGSDVQLLNFTGSQCPHCQKMEPVLGQLEQQGIAIKDINVEQHVDIARRFRVEAIPTYIVLVNGQEAGRVVGATSYDKLLALVPHGKTTPEITETAVRGQSPEVANPPENRLNSMFSKGNGAPSNTNNTELTAVQARALAASVRLKVEDARGHSIGSGTIIDIHDKEALLITCGHIFRQSAGKGKIVVELFQPQMEQVTGELIGYDLERDVALVSFTSQQQLTATQVAGISHKIAANENVFTIGCDHGTEPTVRPTQVKSVNRYTGFPNIEVAGTPADGRSGGGLFTTTGELIGICNAADATDNEGVYAGLPTVHWQLDRVGLASLYNAANNENFAVANANYEAPVRELAAVQPPPVFTQEQVPANRLPSEASDLEVICIVRSRKNPEAKRQIYVLDNVSHQLLRDMAHSSVDPTTKADLLLQSERQSEPQIATRPIQPNAPIVRGQSADRR